MIARLMWYLILSPLIKKGRKKKNVVKVELPLTKHSGSVNDLEALIGFIITLYGYDNCCHIKKYKCQSK